MIVGSLILLSQLVSLPAPALDRVDAWQVEARAGLDKAVEYLMAHQEEDGAFGHWRKSLSPDDKNWMVPEQNLALQVAHSLIHILRCRRPLHWI